MRELALAYLRVLEDTANAMNYETCLAALEKQRENWLDKIKKLPPLPNDPEEQLKGGLEWAKARLAEANALFDAAVLACPNGIASYIHANMVFHVNDKRVHALSYVPLKGDE